MFRTIFFEPVGWAVHNPLAGPIIFCPSWLLDNTAKVEFTSKLIQHSGRLAGIHDSYRLIARCQEPLYSFEIANSLTMSLPLQQNLPHVALDWDAIIAALGPKGRLHFVGAVLEPIPVQAFALIVGQKSISGSPTGSPGNIARMLAFCARHGIEPQVEQFPMSRVNDALAHLHAGKARYRIVLKADFDA